MTITKIERDDVFVSGCMSMLIIMFTCAWTIAIFNKHGEINADHTKELKKYVDMYPQELTPQWNKVLSDNKITGYEADDMQNLIIQTIRGHQYE